MPKWGDQRLVVSQTGERNSSALYRDVRAELLRKHRDRKNPENGQSARPPHAPPARSAFARRSSFAVDVRPNEENNMLPSLHLGPTDQSICLHKVYPES